MLVGGLTQPVLLPTVPKLAAAKDLNRKVLYFIAKYAQVPNF